MPPPVPPRRDAVAVEACRAAFPGGADPGLEAGCRAVVTGGDVPGRRVDGSHDAPGARPVASPEEAVSLCAPAAWLSFDAAECVAHHAGLPAAEESRPDRSGLHLAPWQNAPIYAFHVLTHATTTSCSGVYVQLDAIDGTVRSQGGYAVSHCWAPGLPAPEPNRRPRRGRPASNRVPAARGGGS